MRNSSFSDFSIIEFTLYLSGSNNCNDRVVCCLEFGFPSPENHAFFLEETPASLSPLTVVDDRHPSVC